MHAILNVEWKAICFLPYGVILVSCWRKRFCKVKSSHLVLEDKLIRGVE